MNINRHHTGYTSIGDFEELLITARITEERRVDDQRALPASCACAVQQEVHVDVTVTSERYFTQRCYECIVASVASCLEYDDVFV